MHEAMATVNDEASGPQRVQSVQRAAELLKAVASAGEPAAVAGLAERCGLNRSTAWRLLATLEDHGLVERDAASGGYTVGWALSALAAAAGPEPLVRRAHPYLRALAAACEETASLAIPRRLQLVTVDQVQAPHVMAADWLGRTTPLHATSTGKAFLAQLGADELDAGESSSRRCGASRRRCSTATAPSPSSACGEPRRASWRAASRPSASALPRWRARSPPQSWDGLRASAAPARSRASGRRGRGSRDRCPGRSRRARRGSRSPG
jgi:DNA-binding IclR family transcriptional regulator